MATTSLSTSGLSSPSRYNTAAGSFSRVSTVTGGGLSSDALYYYRTFRASGTFTVDVVPLAAEILIVAGGAGASGGGGGAGGARYEQVTLATGSYTVVVGSGGAGTTVTNTAGAGSNSSFGSYIAYGGGGGGPADNNTGAASGGSGGGGGATSTVNTLGGAGTTNQGHAGGSNYWNKSGPYPACGGGGAGGPGSGPIAGTVAGDGGPGTTLFSQWARATGSGSRGAYAGGGAGSVYNTGYTPGTGGIGGGGGVAWSTSISAIANTGGGGGGTTSSASGGAGGSGIVIIRYLKTAATSIDPFQTSGTDSYIQLYAPMTAALGFSDYSAVLNPSLKSCKDSSSANGAVISSTVSKYYDSSLDLGAYNANKYIAYPNDSKLWLTNQDFTMECWVYFNVNNVGYQVIASHSGDTADAQNGWVFILENNNTLTFLASNGASWSLVLSSSTIPTTGVWHHVAVSRSGTTWRLFYDGTQVSIATANSSNIQSPQNRELRIGSYAYIPPANRGLGGYIQDFTLRVGVGLYTTTFTPPTKLYLAHGL